MFSVSGELILGRYRCCQNTDWQYFILLVSPLGRSCQYFTFPPRWMLCSSGQRSLYSSFSCHYQLSPIALFYLFTSKTFSSNGAGGYGFQNKPSVCVSAFISIQYFLHSLGAYTIIFIFSSFSHSLTRDSVEVIGFSSSSNFSRPALFWFWF